MAVAPSDIRCECTKSPRLAGITISAGAGQKKSSRPRLRTINPHRYFLDGCVMALFRYHDRHASGFSISHCLLGRARRIMACRPPPATTPPRNFLQMAQCPLQRLSEAYFVGEYGDVYFGDLSKNRELLVGRQLSTRASLHARRWSEVV